MSSGHTGIRVSGWVAGAIALYGSGLLFPNAAIAATSARDVQVILRSIAFLTPKPAGTIEIDIVFDPNAANSQKDAEGIKDALDSASDGATPSTAKLVPLTQAGSVDGAVVILAEGTPASGQSVVADAVRGRHILTASADAGCARAGRCVIAVQSTPKVEILFNGTAARAAGVGFLPTFLMMITEL